MNVLVTGASGLLGRQVVQSFLDRGHTVRAMVRPASNLEQIQWVDRVELFRCDLRNPEKLDRAFDDVDAVVHLAACVTGDDQTRFASTVIATEHLLDALSRSRTKQLVLASSFSVYDYSATRGPLDEQAPVERRPGLYERDSYSVAKHWQERIARRYSREHDWDLRILRPGFIWGRDQEWISGMGEKFGPVRAVVAGLGRPPLTHVANCADCFVTVTEHRNAAGETFNVVDGHGVRTWRYVKDYRRLKAQADRSIHVPYWIGLSVAYVAKGLSRMLLGSGARLPGLLIPRRFRARFKPIRCSPQKLERMLGWRPPLNYAQCLMQTYG